MRTLLLLVLSLCLVTGCTAAEPGQGDDVPPPPQPTPEILVTPKADGPCALVSAAEFDRAMATTGATVAKNRPAFCSLVVTGRFTVDVAVKQDLDTYFLFRDGSERVKDVGNDAAYAAAPPRYEFRVLVDDSSYLEFVVIAPGAPPARGQLVTLANTVLDRL